MPLATDLASTENGRRAIEFFAADSVLAWPLVAPPDVPAERVAELRAAFNAMMQDPQLLAEAATQGLDIDPVSGAEIAALVDRLYGTPRGRARSRPQDQRFALRRRGAVLRQTALDERIEVAAGKQISGDAGGAGGLHVDILVADQKACGALDRPVADQVEQHAGPRLAQVGIPAIGRKLALGMERAVARVVDPRALRTQARAPSRRAA